MVDSLAPINQFSERVGIDTAKRMIGGVLRGAFKFALIAAAIGAAVMLASYIAPPIAVAAIELLNLEIFSEFAYDVINGGFERSFMAELFSLETWGNTLKAGASWLLPGAGVGAIIGGGSGYIAAQQEKEKRVSSKQRALEGKHVPQPTQNLDPLSAELTQRQGSFANAITPAHAVQEATDANSVAERIEQGRQAYRNNATQR